MSPARAVRERASRTGRVLVADADAATREMYREWLRETECDVLDAADGRDALVSALVHCPSLVITDTSLPIFDGYQLVDLLRRDVVTRAVPILVVTGESSESELDRARKSGADAVLIKPVSPEALLREVQRLLDQAPDVDRPRRDTASHRRQATTHPTATTPLGVPPTLMCPACDRRLTYESSHVAGVQSHPERWDTFTCLTCGSFEYRHRTRKLRRIGAHTKRAD